ncbi:MAG: hypothetical protein IPO56_08755 [Flavobacteriales bacterium]|nr:hypothetical protein [Flavobacteriales bacterium]
MVRSIGLPLLFAFALGASAQWRYEGNTTPTWEQTMERFQAFAATRSGVQLLEIGTDDDGSPIHLIVLSDGSGFTPDSIRAAGKNILWITNAIHAGEPDGVDASLLLTQALLDSDQYMGLLAHTVVCIVPMYNVSGARQRSSTSRANQNGPAEYGFRANARNLDLNRDFIKADASNTRALVRALTAWDPDVYLETHVTNGADHQYVMELLTTHPDKVDPAMSAYMRNVLSPRLHRWMEAQDADGPLLRNGEAQPRRGTDRLHGWSALQHGIQCTTRSCGTDQRSAHAEALCGSRERHLPIDVGHLGSDERIPGGIARCHPESTGQCGRRRALRNELDLGYGTFGTRGMAWL